MPILVTSPRGETWRRLEANFPTVSMNLAMEEAMARAFSARKQTQTSVRFWSTSKAVVLGRFQEVGAEVDLEQCNLHDVQVARRFTGGGTVYLDKGALNFTIVTLPEYSISRLQDINLSVVLQSLANLGIPCTMSTPNSILTRGRKICGASAALGMDFTLWHCSILVDPDVRLLELTLAPSKSKSNSPFVHSRWQPVTTVAKALSRRITVEEMGSYLEHSIEQSFGVRLEKKPASKDENSYAEELYARKYSGVEWNLFGNRNSVSGKQGGAGQTTMAV